MHTTICTCHCAVPFEQQTTQSHCSRIQTCSHKTCPTRPMIGWRCSRCCSQQCLSCLLPHRINTPTSLLSLWSHSVRYSQTVCLLVGKLWLTTPYIYQPREKHVNPLKPLNTELGNKLPCQRFGTCSRLSSRVTPPGCYGGPTIQPESGRDSYWLLYCVVHSPFNHCQRKLLLFFFMATEVPQVKQTNI